MKQVFTLVLCLITVLLFSQDQIEYIFRPDVNKVIAQGGLNIRSKPSARSEKLGRIPFGKTVQLLQKESYGFEQLQTVTTQLKEYTIKGHWVKVKYENTVGYVNNAYLYSSRVYDPQGDNHKYNKDYILLLPGHQCMNNFHKLSKYNLYGYYQNAENCWLSPIRMEYGRDVSAMADVMVIAKQDKDLVFIIGSRQPLPTGAINTYDQSINVFDQFDANESRKELLSFTNPDMEIKRVKTDNWFDHTLKLKHKHEYQYILDSRYEGDLRHIRWSGDIDGDGRTDYIIDYGEKDMLVVLYLSSERASGSLVTPVARFYSGYCC